MSTEKILKRSTIDQMWVPIKLNSGTTFPQGLCFRIDDVNGHRLAWKDGVFQGYATIISRYLDDHLTIVVFTNLGEDAAIPLHIAERVAAIYIPALEKGTGHPPPAATAQETDQSTKSNQRTAQRLSSQQEEVWKGEQNYFRYLQAKDLQGFMSLWDDNFVGWPDYSEAPLRKKDIESGVAAEFQDVQAARPLPAPQPEVIGVFGDVAVTHYFWPEADDTSAAEYRITHTWRKGPDGWRIIGGMGCAVPRSAGQSAESQPRTMPTSQPSPEMKRLVKALSGRWSISLKVEPSERLPKGGGGKGEEVWKPGPGGFSLIEDYHSTGDEGEITGHGVAWWDEGAQRYQVTWCDNGNPTGCIVMKHGAKWVGNEVVAMNEWEGSGKKFVFKEVFSDITPTSFKQSLYQGESLGELKPVVVIHATKTIR